MRYRDSKCNIGLHKIRVKLLGRLFDLSLIAAGLLLCSKAARVGPTRLGSSDEKLVGARGQTGFSNRRQRGWD